MRRYSALLGITAIGLVASQDVTVPASNWTMEGGSAYREGVAAYDGTADAWGRARFFYASLSDGNNFCTKDVPDTASATPLMYADVWIVCDCSNKIVAYPNPDKLPQNGGLLTPIWTWAPPASFATTYPALATPVIRASQGVMFVLYKDATDPKLFALRLDNGGKTAPAATPLWSIDLGALSGQNSNGAPIVFQTFAQDHAILYYGGKIWVPSRDFDGMLIADALTGSYIISTGLWWVDQRLVGSVGGQANNWQSPVFIAHGSGYGIQSFDGNTGNRTWWSDNTYSSYTIEFSHPVAVTFTSRAAGTVNCIIASQWDQTGDIFISGADAGSNAPCGSWNPNGYTIRHGLIAQPLWVSAPAVLYDGFQTVYLVYAVQLPSGDAPYGRRSGWRSSLVSIQIDLTGPYDELAECYVLTGVRFNAAPLIIRDAWGSGNHIITVGGTDGQLQIFPAKGYSSTGPIFSHNLIPLLPPPGNPAYPTADNSLAGISGNYMAASRGGSVGFIIHNEDAEMNWFGVVTGAMFALPSDVTPTPSPRSYPTASAGPQTDNGTTNNAPGGINTTGAVLGTLGVIGVACAGMVMFLPKAGFSIAIKNGASGAWSAVTGSGGRNSGAPNLTYMHTSSASSPTVGASERAGLLARAKV